MSGEACHSPTSRQVDSIFYTRVGTSSLTLVACLVSLVILSYYVCWRRTWNTFVHRLKLQLTAVALVVSVLYLLQVMPVKLDKQPRDEYSTASKEWTEACKLVIFLQTYGDWVLMLIILWLVIYLCRLAWKIGQPRPISRQTVRYHQKLFEVLGTAAVFTVPLLIVWIPFVDGHYGVDDHKWCGIAMRETCNRTHKNLKGIGYVLGIWYIPSVLITLASTVGMIIAIAIFWRLFKRHGLTLRMRLAVLKGIGPVTYLILFNIINFIDGTNLIYHSLTNEHSWNSSVDYHLWLVHAVTGPARAMAIPFGFIVTQLFTECCFRKRRETYNELS